MANIPLVQIPNAPATGSTAVPLPVGAIRTPDVELMGMIDDASYMAVGRAYENLGNAGQQAANVLGDFSLSMARASDEANLAAADRIKTDMVSKFDAEVATKPESEWNSIWENNYAPKLRDQVSSLKMTTRDGLNRRDTWLANTENGIKAQVFTSANKAMIGRATQEQKNYIERAKLEGRWEDAMAGYRRGAEVGLWTPEEAEAGMIGIEREQKWETTSALVQTNPRESVRDLEQAVFNGTDSKMFPNLKTSSERAKALNMAYGSLKTQESALYREGIEQIFDGTFTTPDQIAKEYEGILDPKDIQSLQSALESTPEQQARRLQHVPAIDNMIDAYDPQEDDTGARAVDIRANIHQLPEGYQRQFIDRLDQKIRNNKPVEATAISAIRTNAQKDFEGGRYGKWKVDEKFKMPANEAEEAKRDAAMLQYSREMSEFNRWAKRNPDATDEDAYKEINRIRLKNYQARKGDGQETLRPPVMTAPDPREVQRKAREIRGQPQASAGGVYREGSIGPTSTGPHFDIKRADRGFWDRNALDSYVLVNGEPLSSGKTVDGGRFGASRSYGAHKGWDFAFGGKGVLTLTNGAVWLDTRTTAHGDKARFRTPDGQVYEILHGKFEPA
jgi:hypothetical protein